MPPQQQQWMPQQQWMEPQQHQWMPQQQGMHQAGYTHAEASNAAGWMAHGGTLHPGCQQQAWPPAHPWDAARRAHVEVQRQHELQELEAPARA